METQLNAFKSIFTYLKYKLIYGRKYASHPIQSWGAGFRVHISAAKSSAKTAPNPGLKSILTIGPHCVSRRNMSIRVENGALSIGAKCFFNANMDITCIDHITIGDGCQFGQNVVIVDHDHNFRKEGEGVLISSPITIGNNVWVGANCVILRGVTIGDNAVIAAGSVIHDDVPADSVVYQKREECVVNNHTDHAI